MRFACTTSGKGSDLGPQLVQIQCLAPSCSPSSSSGSRVELAVLVPTHAAEIDLHASLKTLLGRP